ncbi:MAG: mannose-1-phosphate guanylyltransferase [Anaerolineales bacterium]|jgi:mannose-1-phosphate guanylyltransferase
MHDNYYAVIMAGGGGTRLWPLSRAAQPKQMLQLIGERSLFQIAVERLAGEFPAQRILVVTIADQVDILRKQAPEIPLDNFIIEPMPRGTASVIGLAGIVLQERAPEAVMAVLTADHFIGNVEKFLRLLNAAYKVAQDGYLVTLGIEPTLPATGYGYIQQGEPIGKYDQLQVYRALKFKEKPELSQAEAMLASGDHAWNSGMFVWQVERIMAEIALQMPELSTRLERISSARKTPDHAEVLNQQWTAIKAQTIDYGIMEGARDVAVIPAEGLRWNDVGSWDSLFDVFEINQDGNILLAGQYIGEDTRGSLIYQDQDQRLIVTIGVEDLVIVDTGDVLLVCKKDSAQKVRQIVEQLHEIGKQYV